ncbi:MAG: hypothetical protein ABJM06_06395 [Gilvibacter sp.]
MYPEITQLESFVLEHDCHCTLLQVHYPEFGALVPCNLRLKRYSFDVFLDDEYEDVKRNNQLLLFELSLQSLVQVRESSDFLDWCNQLGLNPVHSSLLDYYKKAHAFCEQIAFLFTGNTVQGFISNWDFGLNAGAAQYLRTHSNQ